MQHPVFLSGTESSLRPFFTALHQISLNNKRANKELWANNYQAQQGAVGASGTFFLSARFTMAAPYTCCSTMGDLLVRGGNNTWIKYRSRWIRVFYEQEWRQDGAEALSAVMKPLFWFVLVKKEQSYWSIQPSTNYGSWRKQLSSEFSFLCRSQP